MIPRFYDAMMGSGGSLLSESASKPVTILLLLGVCLCLAGMVWLETSHETEKEYQLRTSGYL